jgi:Leu/Phe-tRNA-protein transferase
MTAFRGLPLDDIASFIGVARRPTDVDEAKLFDVKDALFGKRKEEFCVAAMYAPQFVDRAVQIGLLPMTIRLYSNVPDFLALKLHVQRSIIPLSPAVRTPQGIRKKAKKFALVVDGDFWETCMEALTEQHKREHGNCWLNPFLDKCFHAMNVEPSKFTANLHCISVVHAENVPALVAARAKVRAAREAYHRASDTDPGKVPALMAAMNEFKPVAKAAFAAGEIGVTCGARYMALTGCHVASGAGSIQLGALMALLVHAGYELADMGMQMDYKRDSLGAVEVPRKQWLAMAKDIGSRLPGAKRAAASAAAASSAAAGSDKDGASGSKGRKLSELDGYIVNCATLMAVALKPEPAAAGEDGAAPPAAAK